MRTDLTRTASTKGISCGLSLLFLIAVVCGPADFLNSIGVCGQDGNAGSGPITPAEQSALMDVLHFHAPFDGTPDATTSSGSGRLLTADSLERRMLTQGIHRADVSIAKGEGRYGDCLRFAGKTKEVLCFAGTEMHYSPHNWSGSVSLWLRLDPDEDLLPGYSDPLQITQHAWNNGAFFVDFDKDVPRDFRLGVFSDLAHWNPENIPWDEWPVEKRPLVPVVKPPFSRTEWTHVAFTFENINPTDDQISTATFYLNGQPMGEIRQPMLFTWDLEKTAIMLGIDYIGDLDELMIFRRALTAREISLLYSLPTSLTAAAIDSAADVGRVRAFIDDEAPGWHALTSEDFAHVNSDEDTWSWNDGILHCTGQPVSVLRTVQQYRNFELVVEWMHEKPAGNSGVFLWATPESIAALTEAGKPGLPKGIEVQILDHGYTELMKQRGQRTDWFGTNGDVFPVGVRMKPFPPLSPDGSRSFPRKHLAKGHGEWNHYYIRAINGEVRLWVNGEEVSGGNGCDPAEGYLCLESEGSPIVFRRLRIRELP